MSVSKDEPIDEVKDDRNTREKPGLPRKLVAIGGLLAVKEGKCSGGDEQRGRDNREIAARNHDGREDGNGKNQGNGFHGVNWRKA